jgi:hypothetical protein
VHIPKRSSHSSQIRHIESRDGSISIPPPHPIPVRDRRRRSKGFLVGADLLEWVANPETEAQKRVDTILRLIVELRDLKRTYDKGVEQTFSWQGKIFITTPNDLTDLDRAHSNNKRRHLSMDLNSCLQRYKFAPHYWYELGDRPLVGWSSGIERPQDPNEPREDVWYTEEDAIICIVELAREGLLKDLRKCHHCGDWFFASFIHQKFCQKSCQQEHFRSSPEYKEARRVYMRNHRATYGKRHFKAPKRNAKKAEK